MPKREAEPAGPWQWDEVQLHAQMRTRIMKEQLRVAPRQYSDVHHLKHSAMALSHPGYHPQAMHERLNALERRYYLDSSGMRDTLVPQDDPEMRPNSSRTQASMPGYGRAPSESLNSLVSDRLRSSGAPRSRRMRTSSTANPKSVWSLDGAHTPGPYGPGGRGITPRTARSGATGTSYSSAYVEGLSAQLDGERRRRQEIEAKLNWLEATIHDGASAGAKTPGNFSVNSELSSMWSSRAPASSRR
mmetsp:Transcript_50049/g.109439  ORF Transcript_50049/g.109439 Transcript_50049/m.109439 type:complete len:245 (+) Transcript_50049:33-767(+)